MTLFEAQHLSPEDETRARKSVFASASTTLIFAALQINHTSVDLFGFSFSFSQEEIVGVLRLVTAYLLLVFCLRFLPGANRSILQLLYDRNSAKAAKEISFHYENLVSHGEPSIHSNIDLFESEKVEIEHKLKQLEIRFKKADGIVSTLPGLLLDYILPIAFGVSVVLWPDWGRMVLIPLAVGLP
ncbi:hypothetical protein [uncultured Shimia sp.]|uniref:hypothetical protein n=1 Tax=uncultured Shimia sp. TaxID=573152 RepID=UPI0026348F9E|nr:hypothetical protein [uncultured Shimia sp.]